MQLRGQVAIVTGAAVRIGRALAEWLLRNDVRVVCHYGSSQNEAESLQNEFGSDRVALAQADFRDPADAAQIIFDKTLATFGAPSILINSAAIFEAGKLLDSTDANWYDHLEINLSAPFFLSQLFAKNHPPGHRGHVLNIVDWRALRVCPGHLAYSVSKSGLVHLTQQLALELAPDVQVNAIAPGAILPPPGESSAEFQQRTQNIPLRRTGSPESIVAAAEYLLQSDFVTGEVLHVTGGEHLAH